MLYWIFGWILSKIFVILSFVVFFAIILQSSFIEDEFPS